MDPLLLPSALIELLLQPLGHCIPSCVNFIPMA